MRKPDCGGDSEVRASQTSASQTSLEALWVGSRLRCTAADYRLQRLRQRTQCRNAYRSADRSKLGVTLERAIQQPELQRGCLARRPSATEIASDLAAPWGLIPLKDRSFLIAERDEGKIVRVENGSASQVRTIDEVDPGGEGGLLGLAITKDGKTVFAYYTAANDNRIVSMSWDGRELGAPKVILRGIPKGFIHNGGRMVVGPDDYLYVGTGESGTGRLSQRKDSLGGKILRLRLDGRPAPGNPFDNEVFSYGHRNVQGLAFDNEGRLWASEFGQNRWDELNLITKGADYGWPDVEGSGNVRGMTNPKVVWHTDEASPSGLAYWQNSLWMAGLRGQRLWEIPVDGTKTGDQ